MAQQYNDENTGIIGKNDYKEKDAHPDQKGRVNVGGLWYWLAGWEKTKNGRNFTSLAFTLMTQDEVDKMLQKRAEKERPQQGQAPQQQAGTQQQAPQQSAPQQAPQLQPNNPPQDFDDDIPF